MMKLTLFKVVPLWILTGNDKAVASDSKCCVSDKILEEHSYDIIKEQNLKPADTDQSTIKPKKNHVS